MQTNPIIKRTLLGLGLAAALGATARADFDPIPLTPESFSHDVVVEKAAPTPLNAYATATMDGGTNNNAWVWFEQGYLPSLPAAGLPEQGTTFTAVSDVAHVFKMASDYTANNALLVYSNALPTAKLTFTAPGAYYQLSALVASGGGAVPNLAYTIHYQNGATEIGSIQSPDWFNSPPEIAWNAAGRLNFDNGQVGNLRSADPKLFYADIYLMDASTPVTGITFASTNGFRAAVFGISGWTSIDGCKPIDLAGFNRDMIVEKTAPVTGTLQSRINTAMDSGYATVTGNTWYEVGFNPAAPATGLPAAGSTLVVGGTNTFVMPASYTTNNALFIAAAGGFTSGTLTLDAPAAYTGISFLTAAGNGPLVATVTVTHNDATTEEFSLSIPDWFNQPNEAYIAAGRVNPVDMTFNNVNSTNPRLFAVNIAPAFSTPITQIAFVYSSGGRAPIFAVSGQTTAGGAFNPVAVSGFNADVVVEANPPWPPRGLQAYTTASMDGGVGNTGNTWVERGIYPQFPECGLPPAGTIITSLDKSDHHYQLPATYTGNNAAFVDSVRSNINLTLAEPKAYSALSFLSATANNSVTNEVVIQFQDGTSETNTFTSRDWFNNSPYAYTARGRVNLINGTINNAHTTNPRLYEAEFPLMNHVSPVTNIVLKFLGAFNPTTGRMVVLAVSATAGAVRPIIRTVPSTMLVLEGPQVFSAAMGGGDEPISYQWYRGTGGAFAPIANGGAVSGANTTDLTYSPMLWSDGGDFYMVASNVAGSSTSAVFTVTLRSGLADVTQPGDSISIYQPNGGDVPPANENVEHSIDNLMAKYLNRGGGESPFVGPAGFVVTPSMGGSIVSVLRFYTANDAETRDPVNYLFEGSRDGGGTYTTIATGSLALPAARNATAADVVNPLTQNLQEVRISNTSGYTTYRMSFSSVKGATETLTQIGEVELLGVADPNSAPTVVSAPVNTVANEGGTATFSVTAVGPGTLGYQWYDVTWGDPGTPVAGQNGPTMVLSAITAAMNGNLYRVVVSNEFGAVTGPAIANPAAQLAVNSGPPMVVTDIDLDAVIYAGRTYVLSVPVIGSEPITYRWQKNGINLADTDRITGSQSNVLTIVNVQAEDAGNYQLATIQNSQGNVQTSIQALTVQTVAALTPYGAGWALGGAPSPATVTDGVLELSAGVGSTARSAWYKHQLYVGAFKASFTYQDVGGAGADGIAFVVQRDPRGTTALGANGGSLGYSGITPSAALQINIYANNTPGIAFHTNGATGTYTATGPVNVASGDPIKVTMIYLDGVAHVTLSNMVNAATYTVDLPVGDFPEMLGGDLAWVGFTGATGGTPSTQHVTEFQYIPLPTLAAERAGGQVVLSWPAAIPGYKVQAATSLNPADWADAGLTEILVDGQYQATTSVGTGNRFYRLAMP